MLVYFLEKIRARGRDHRRRLQPSLAWSGRGIRALHTGSLHTYVYWFLLGAVVLWAFAAGLLH